MTMIMLLANKNNGHLRTKIIKVRCTTILRKSSRADDILKSNNLGPQ